MKVASVEKKHKSLLDEKKYLIEENNMMKECMEGMFCQCLDFPKSRISKKSSNINIIDGKLSMNNYSRQSNIGFAA